jgi:cation transport regulator ChaC
MKKTACLVLVFCIGGLLWNNCRQLPVEKPEQLLEESVVEDMLLEIYLIEATVRTGIHEKNRIDMQAWTRSQIAKLTRKHDANYEQFVTSLNYYMSGRKPQMLENIVNRLVKMEVEAEAVRQTEKLVQQDTLNRIINPKITNK